MEENTENTSVAKTYIFKQLNKEIGRINLAKELVVTSGTVKEVVTENVPYQGAKVGEKYIELIIANQAEPLYIPANDLVEYITTEDTATIDLTLDADHKLTAELKDGAVTAGKLEEAVQTKLGYIDVNKNITVAIADAVAIANGYADDLNDDMDARVQVLEGIDHDAYIAADTVLQGVLEGKIATAKGEAISDADGKLDAYKGEVVTTLTNYYNKTEIDGKVGAINTAIEGEAAARGELATEVANDKQALADYKTEMATALGKKVDTGTIAHTSENVEEGVTRNGTSLDIVVDAYKKAETYTRGEVDKAITDKIQAVTGGENASAVKLALSDYIKANDTEIYGATKVAEWTVDGVYTPDYTKESRLDSLKGQADVNARDILALQNTVNGTADNNGEDGLVRRLAKLETEVRTDVDQRLDTAEGAISGLTELTGTHTGQIKTIVETTIPGLQGAINGKVAQGDFDALNNKVDTGDKNVSKYVEDAVKVEENRAKGEEARVEGLVTAEANRAKGEESRIEGLVTAEAGRADLAEKALGKRIDDLTNGAVKDNTDEIAAINAILNTISDTDNITSLKELAIWVEEHETEVIPVVNKNTEDIAALNTKVDTGDKNVSKYVEDAIAAAAYTLPAATVAALGGIKSAADVEGKVVANKVYVDATTNVGEVKAISTDLLVQGDTELILNGGNAALN